MKKIPCVQGFNNRLMANADTQITVCTPSMHLITFLIISEMISATNTYL